MEKVHAHIIIGEGNSVRAEVVNAPNSWDNLWIVSAGTGFSWYLISANSMEDAIDEWADYCADMGYTGHVCANPVEAGWILAEEFDWENPSASDLSQAGNSGLYYTNHEVTCWQLPTNHHELNTANAILWLECSEAGLPYFGEPAFDKEEFLQGLAGELRRIASSLDGENIDPHGGDPEWASVDVRLYLRPNIEWETCSGLSDYDTDHRGWCGASCARRHIPESLLRNPEVPHHLEEAKELLSQVLDVLYDGKPSWLVIN